MTVHPLDPDMEIYTEDLRDKLSLCLMEQNDRGLVWKATVRPGDVTLPGSTPTRAGDIEHSSPSTERHTGGGTRKTMSDHLLDTLKNLQEVGMKEFKSKLTDINLEKGYQSHIPRCDLEKAGPVELTELLIRYYTENYGVEVTTMVLEAINQRALAERLRRATVAGQE
ncbi:pyrin-like [Mauremys reevesii]|uniref:pyrin-like n=1 Tax=Mauremys reevesii TaxID=260615 RepID=UPI00193F7428|nr:pyrin-like [Mauremys reevesii]